MMYLDFEKPLAELNSKIKALDNTQDNDGVDIGDELLRLRSKSDQLLIDIYGKLTPWQKTQIARHPQRPHFIDYSKKLVSNFQPLAGDRLFSEDQAIIGGPARFRGQPIMLIGHEKGSNTQSRIKHNFGMAMPEGYRKAIRLMKLADHFQIPIVTLIDTPGAYPGIGAEERGQAEAIARAQEVSFKLSVPFISIIVGEGGSGGAVALASSNRVYMLEHSIYSVISPEGCASILWNQKSSANKVADAAGAMKVSAQSLLELKVIDGIISEPLGAAHRNHNLTINNLGDQIATSLSSLQQLSKDAIVQQRFDRFLEIGKLS